MSPTPKSHFIHRLDYSTRERLVGIFVLIATGLLIAQIFVSGQAIKFFEPKRTYIITLKNPVGVSADTKVRVSGLEVGWVDNVTLTQSNTFKIELAVYEKFAALIRQDSRASVSKLAIVGDSVINISPGSIKKRELVDGDQLIAEEGMSMEDIMAKIQPVLEQAQKSADHLTSFLEALPTEAMPKIMADLQEIMSNMKAMSSQIVSGDNVINDVVYGNALQTNMNKTFAEINQTLKDSQVVMAEVSLVIAKLPVILDDTHGLVLEADTQMQQLPSLMDDTNVLLDGSQQVLDAVSNTWPLSKLKPKEAKVEAIDALPAN